ncbi:MAG: hypothetical protein GWP10_21645 [Nitrospiraceae bacterium]|nr:hypothetical protein [Nitrospiraceae bacterium]
MESATLLQTPILLSEKKWLKEFKEQHGLDTYGDAIAKIIDVYKRTQMTPAQIVAANDPEVFEAEHVIALALEVITDSIPEGGHE